MKKIIYLVILLMVVASCERSVDNKGIAFHNNSRIINKNIDTVWDEVINSLPVLNHQMINSSRSKGQIIITGNLTAYDLMNYAFEEHYKHISSILSISDSTIIQLSELEANESQIAIESHFIVNCTQEMPRGKFAFTDDYTSYPKSKGVFENILLDRFCL